MIRRTRLEDFAILMVVLTLLGAAHRVLVHHAVKMTIDADRGVEPVRTCWGHEFSGWWLFDWLHWPSITGLIPKSGDKEIAVS